MRTPPDLVCAVCHEEAEDASLLSECLDCSRWYHLNPYSNRPGKDCGDAMLGSGDGVETICNDCIEAAEHRRVAALGADRAKAEGLAGTVLGSHIPLPPQRPGEAPPEGARRAFRRVEDE
ncbi:MAG: hypothetical protein M0R75_08800 [Dehalococcoidia bacterium]|nr:hypothetical protein [Dehalococcoidia bacterium]